MYRVILLLSARRFFENAEPPVAKKLARCFQALEQTPRVHPNIKTLSGPLSGQFRFRAGAYRVVYQIDDAARQVQVLRIAHRSEIYR
jgi:mRNA interferase RelE/StbE